MIVRFARCRLEHDHHFRIERSHIVSVEILLRVERQAIYARPERLARGIQGPRAAVVIGVTAPDVVPPAIVGAPLERNADSRGGAALCRIQNVSRNSAH